MSSNQNKIQKKTLGLPSDKTLQQATKLSIQKSKPICFYFFVDSLKNKVCITSDGEDNVIYKSDEEHTSPIINIYKCSNEYIVLTENTIYIISANIKVN